jgi:uncharacterized membrane protein YhaH (DUF805 family)
LGFLLSPFGRVSRRGFWLGYVVVFAILIAAAQFADMHFAEKTPPPSSFGPLQDAILVFGGPFTVAVALLIPWVTFVMLVKRLHDRGFGGLMLIWKIVLLGALFWAAFSIHHYLPAPWGQVASFAAGVLATLMILRLLIIVMFLPGQNGTNRYGADPLAG